MTKATQAGEIAIIRRLSKLLPKAGRDVTAGPGDDCAIVQMRPGCANEILLKSDPVIEGVHFSRGARPQLIGRKALGRVLSDVAAMGGIPRWALFNVVAPPATPLKTLECIYRGIAALAAEHGVSVVGGDVSSGNVIEVHAFAAGSVPCGTAVLRSGANKGDLVCVTGSLGGSIKGKHLRFNPRVREGIFLRKWATAMIDVSDGLASDLAHVAAASNLRAVVDADSIPVSPDAGILKHPLHFPVSAATRITETMLPAPLKRALYDGEDFELLFTIRPERSRAFIRAWRRCFKLPCTLIGAMKSGKPEIVLAFRGGKTLTLTKRGYEHFRH